MRLFLDESLSPRIAQALNASGRHLVLHPRDHGGLGKPDHAVLARCVEQDLVLVTENARDFRALVAVADIHPGLITLPSAPRARSLALLEAAIAFLDARGDPMDAMVNHVLEMDEDDGAVLYPLPTT